MGVQGLWELLAPVGCRVSVEALSGRKLAVDASIWIIQFMKAMRDDKGDMIRNAHLLGFFRRICKLLYLRAKPVFVFDGGTPALKRRTVIARRRQRERAQSKMRKTAEKLLLNHLRTRKLDEIAQNIGLGQSVSKPEKPNTGLTQPDKKQGKTKDTSRRWQAVRSNRKGEEENEIEGATTQQRPVAPQEASMLHDEGKSNDHFTAPVTTEVATSDNDKVCDESDDTDNDDAEYFLPPTQGRVDPAVLASLPPSMQLNLLVQMREQLVADNRKKFQKVAKNPASFSQMQIQAYLKTVAFRRDIDQVQKAAAGKGIGGIPSARIASEVGREYIFSTNFQPEKQDTELRDVGAHEEPGLSEETVIEAHSSQLQKQVPEKGDLYRNTMLTGRAQLTPMKILATNDSEDDSHIEWEDGAESAVPVPSKLVNGAVITIEVDEADVLAKASDVDKFHQDAMSESEEIEWEEDVSMGVLCNDNELKDAAESSEECDVGTNALTLTGLDSPEEVNRTLMEIEAAELEEAINQSLQDHKAFKETKLIIKDEGTTTRNENDIQSHGNIASKSSTSEEAYLARERERKGKAIVDDRQDVFLGNRDVDDTGHSIPVEPGLKQVDTDATEQLQPVLIEGNFVPAGESKIPTESYGSVISQIDISLPFKDDLCGKSSIALTKQANSLQTESASVGDLGAGCRVETSVKSEVPVKEAPICQSFSDLEKVGEMENLENKNELNYELQESFDTPDLAKTSANAILRHEKVVPSRMGHGSQPRDEQLQEALLKEAEEVDLIAERVAFAKQERNLMVEREELAHQQVELQAAMEAEQAAMQATLQEERDFLLQEEEELRANQRKNERNAESVSGEMFSECQELLQMFGLPYIIAPMEAEAQCAQMDSTGLVDGVVTDDSDVFLFGGRNVFKNIFDDRKYVETYYMKDIESELGLDQQKLIHMALLLGSDYTEGISGIGIVNAIEVVNAFEGEVGLQKFKEWLDAPDLTLLQKIRQDDEKKQIRKKKIEKEVVADVSHVTEEDPDDASKGGLKYNLRQQDFMDKHRAVSKNWNVPESFPNPMVINAYRSPQVDNSSEAFTWGRPDLDSLRSLCLERFGWNKSKSDELLVPVLKEYDRHETQLRLEAFYTFNQRFAKIRSKRIQKAVSRGTGRLSSELVDFPKTDNFEVLSPLDGKTNDSSLENKHAKKAVLPTKTSTKMAAASGKRRSMAAPGEGANAVRGKKKSVVNRGRAKASKRAGSRLLAEGSLSDRVSSEEMSDLDQHKSVDDVSVVPRRSSRLPRKTIYNFSDSDEDLAKNSGHDGMVCSPEVDHVEKHSAFSSSKGLETETNQFGGKTNGPSADSPHGIEAIGDESQFLGSGSSVPDGGNGSMEEASRHPVELSDHSYLVMGGGFCAADADADADADDKGMQNLSCEPGESQIVMEGAAATDSLNSTPTEPACSGMPFVGSTSFRDCLDQETASQSKPSFRAVPSLRRKKRRTS